MFVWKRAHRYNCYLHRVLKLRLGTSFADQSKIADVLQTLSRFKPHASPVPLVRVGSKNDGGYLVPEGLTGISALFSPGVGNNIEFDLAIAEMGINVHLADNSVDIDVNNRPNVSFVKKHIGHRDSDETLTLETWINQKAPDVAEGASGDLMLQMDIEGAEWGILSNSAEQTLRRFQVLIVEVHELQKVFQQSGLDEVNAFLENLEKTHKLVFTHVNNGDILVRHRQVIVPPLVELVFLRSSLSPNWTSDRVFKPNLHIPNDPDFRDSNQDFWDQG
jgi:hypothetical protein